MKNKKVLLISIVLILLVLLEASNVFAIDITNQTNQGGNNTVQNTNTPANNTITNTNTNTNNSISNSSYNTSNTANRITNTSNKTNTNSSSSGKLPKAGSDPTIIFAILGLTISAIYAYKKVSDYNIKL